MVLFLFWNLLRFFANAYIILKVECKALQLWQMHFIVFVYITERTTPFLQALNTKYQIFPLYQMLRIVLSSDLPRTFVWHLPFCYIIANHRRFSIVCRQIGTTTFFVCLFVVDNIIKCSNILVLIIFMVVWIILHNFTYSIWELWSFKKIHN